MRIWVLCTFVKDVNYQSTYSGKSGRYIEKTRKQEVLRGRNDMQ